MIKAVAPRRDHLIAWSSVAALAAGIFLFVGFGALGLDDPAGHSTSHLAFGVPALVLLFVAIKKWPRPYDDRYGRATRRILIAGLAMAGIGQLIEGIGAFGSDGNAREKVLANIHDLGVGVGASGLLVLISGIGLSLAIWIARRVGIIGSRWMPIFLGIPIIAVVLFILGSFVFGY